MKIGLLKEIKDKENRVGLTPTGVRELVGSGHEVRVEAGAGLGSGFADADYMAKISGIAIENASPSDQVSYTVTISDSIFHGLDSGSL